MAVLTAVLSDTQRRTLRAVCDTVVPATPACDGDSAVMRDFLARAASELGVPEQIEGLIHRRRVAVRAD